MRKKLTILCIAAILIPWLSPSTASAQRCLSILPDTSVVTTGAQFSLDVVVNDDVDSLMGWDVAVGFDPSYLEIVGVAEGSLPEGSGLDTFFRWLNPGCGCDSVLVNGSLLGDTVDGPGTLFTITFRALRVGTTAVGIVKSDLRNGVNEKLTHDVAGAAVTIEPPGSLFILPVSTDTHVFEQFQVEIAVNDEIDSLMGYDITIDFDDSHLQVLNVEEGSLPEESGFNTFFQWMNPGCGCDSAFVNGSILGDVVDGPGTLFTITFRAISVGTTTITIRRSDLRNGVNEKLAHSRRDAVVAIEYPPTGADSPAFGAGRLVNYPNPFNPSTTIALWLGADGASSAGRDVTLEIYSVAGLRVRTLFAGALPPGKNEMLWDGKDDRGAVVAAGVYIGVARTEIGVFKNKMVVVR
jgi:hypothetical protein